MPLAMLRCFCLAILAGVCRAGVDTCEPPHSMRPEAAVVLRDGTVFRGRSFGWPEPVSGEVVFSTAMVGYVEALTDPSYRGQILVLTQPLVGNYGVPGDAAVDPDGVEPALFESRRIQVAGLVVAANTDAAWHWQADRRLSDWLAQSRVPAIEGVDTRALTKHLRSGSVIAGQIAVRHNATELGSEGGPAGPAPWLPSPSLAFVDTDAKDLVSEVSTPTVRWYANAAARELLAGGEEALASSSLLADVTTVLVLDCGLKLSIVRLLLRRVAAPLRIKVVPHDHDLAADAGPYHAVLVSNGPGNPERAERALDAVRWAVSEAAGGRPVFGICLGHQLLALALGGKCYKLPFGHRGFNQPVQDLVSTRTFITTQNHGFAVENASLPDDVAPLFRHLNDDSSQGLYHRTSPFFSAQFHPEANGGPLDSTTTVVFQAVERGYGKQDISGGAAISVILFLIVLTISLIQRYLTREK